MECYTTLFKVIKSVTYCLTMQAMEALNVESFELKIMASKTLTL